LEFVRFTIISSPVGSFTTATLGSLRDSLEASDRLENDFGDETCDFGDETRDFGIETNGEAVADKAFPGIFRVLACAGWIISDGVTE